MVRDGRTNALIAGMVRLFQRLGGTVARRAVERITTAGDQVTGIVTAKGELMADMVATNGDVVHSYGLIKDHPARHPAEAKLKRRTFSPEPVRSPLRH